MSGAAELDWQSSLRHAVRDAAELCRILQLTPSIVDGSNEATGQFPVFVPPHYLSLIERRNADDPLLRQVLPIAAESATIAGFSADPLGENHVHLGHGMLQKYAGRALMVLSGACAVHCRYCFRRHFPYSEAAATPAQWEQTLAQIAADTTLHEVLLSGGDPLMLPDRQLSELTSRLAEIQHLRRLRIHSRLPIVIPQRVTDQLIDLLSASRLVPWFVVHANHPRELDAVTGAALGRLVDAGIPVLNQAVLLRGVNDHVDTLAELCERLVDLRVTPYYLHQLDRVAGAAHFEVPIDEGRLIIRQLQERLPGYAVPRYVQEIPGAASKLPVG
ncbi:MAG: EF-P beta-lysylation protein EpmB [Planctomycetales bacterium]|nr:EF-P beta-lysylation protein EpmB [Planctomycetales bacterium]